MFANSIVPLPARSMWRHVADQCVPVCSFVWTHCSNHADQNLFQRCFKSKISLKNLAGWSVDYISQHTFTGHLSLLRYKSSEQVDVKNFSNIDASVPGTSGLLESHYSQWKERCSGYLNATNISMLYINSVYQFGSFHPWPPWIKPYDTSSRNRYQCLCNASLLIASRMLLNNLTVNGTC